MPFTATDRQNVEAALQSMQQVGTTTRNRLRACRRTDPLLPATTDDYRTDALNEVQRVQVLPSVAEIDQTLQAAATIEHDAKQALDAERSLRQDFMTSQERRDLGAAWEKAQRTIQEYPKRLSELEKRILEQEKKRDENCKYCEKVDYAKEHRPKKEQELAKLRSEITKQQISLDAAAVGDRRQEAATIEGPVARMRQALAELELLRADRTKVEQGASGDKNSWAVLDHEARLARQRVVGAQQALERIRRRTAELASFAQAREDAFREEFDDECRKVARQEKAQLDHLARSTASLLQQADDAEWDALRAQDQIMMNRSTAARHANAARGKGAVANQRAQEARTQAATALANLDYATDRLRSFGDDIVADSEPAKKALQAVTELEQEAERHRQDEATAADQADQSLAEAERIEDQGRQREQALSQERAEARKTPERLRAMLAENEQLGQEILQEGARRRQAAQDKLNDQLDWIEERKLEIKKEFSALEEERKERAEQLLDARKRARPLLEKHKLLRSSEPDWQKFLAVEKQQLADAEKNLQAAQQAVQNLEKNFGNQFPKVDLNKAVATCPVTSADHRRIAREKLDSLRSSASESEKELRVLEALLSDQKRNRTHRTACEDATNGLAEAEKQVRDLKEGKRLGDETVQNLAAAWEKSQKELAALQKKIDDLEAKRKSDLKVCLGEETPDSLQALGKQINQGYANLQAAARLPIIRRTNGALPPNAPTTGFNDTHVFQGELKGPSNDRYLVGCHSTCKFASLNQHQHSKTNTFDETQPNAVGIYEAKVFRAGASSKQRSTFYPDNWDEQDIQVAIDCAMGGVQFRDCATNTYVERTISVDVGGGVIHTVRIAAYADREMYLDLDKRNDPVVLNTVHPKL